MRLSSDLKYLLRSSHNFVLSNHIFQSLVVACGTRKVWSKVFKSLDTPQQQIKKLKELLADLGMTGRMSMEQAKAIKEKRELAQELRTSNFCCETFPPPILAGLLMLVLRGRCGVRGQSDGSNFEESEGIL